MTTDNDAAAARHEQRRAINAKKQARWRARHKAGIAIERHKGARPPEAMSEAYLEEELARGRLGRRRAALKGARPVCACGRPATAWDARKTPLCDRCLLKRMEWA